MVLSLSRMMFRLPVACLIRIFHAVLVAEDSTPDFFLRFHAHCSGSGRLQDGANLCTAPAG
ncbi:Hypothetical protein GbCGDNIH9_8741 [Granulibacter bethesdensis]|uniref:Uncharacterized protein n=1 Tax=Granulibacter bethesdensis TaxID=364410 RepID=A0AAC9KEH0_9PROT|nr:Hypothetical protein GbCGDNIH9_8741 [Granulibacter bethesdensis]